MNFNEDKPLFFVFTCVKNGRSYIQKLFDSLLHQTKVNFVHFIYEDGSSNPLEEMINDYKKQVAQLEKPYKVIYEFNPINIGLNRSTQYCISKCSCPYFIWIDCDNFVDYSFFEEMEKLYKSNKNSLLLRSILYNADNQEKEFYCNCGTIDEAKTKYQLGLFIRRRYYYSFFAVNYKLYSTINPNNFMLHERSFYNDEQLLIVCLLNCDYAPLSKKAKGYFLTRDGQESKQYELSLKEIRNYQLELCRNINEQLESKLKAMYLIKDLYDDLRNNYKTNYELSCDLLKKIKKSSKEHNISLKHFYDSSLLKFKLKMYYWRFKKH